MANGHQGNTINVELPPLHQGGQYNAFYDETRFKIMMCGRRWGKSLLGMTEAVTCAMGDPRKETTPGAVWWVWPNFPMAMLGWRKILTQLEPLILSKVVNLVKVERLIEFPGGGFIQFKSADKPNSLRGEGLDLLIVDEWAYINNGGEVWEQELRATLTDRMGKALLITTPNYKVTYDKEYFYKAADDPDYIAIHHPTWDNPHIPQSEIKSAKRNLPDKIFRQEYGAEFIEGDADFFRNLENVAVLEQLFQPSPGRQYRAGIDFGRFKDHSVLAIIDCGEDMHQISPIIKIPHKSMKNQIDQILAVCRMFDVDYACSDATGMGLGPTEMLQENAPFTVEGITYSNQQKLNMFDKLATRYEMGTTFIQKDKWIQIEHEMMQPEINPKTLKVKLNARPGFNDDAPNACALAEMAAKQNRITMHLAEA